MKVINACARSLNAPMAIALVEDALSSGLRKEDLRWRMGPSEIVAVQILFLVCEPEGLAKDQSDIRAYLLHGNPGKFLGVSIVRDDAFSGIELSALGGGPTIGGINNLAIPAVRDYTEGV